jgi:Mg2+ and Co2+ transporter CorA
MKDDKKISLTDRVSNLYKQYIRFVNRIYFREVTAQEQGIEFYDMLQKHMKIESNVKDLDDEIGELHSYTTLIEEQKQNQNIELLTVIGALFILPSFINGFFGMNIFPQAISLNKSILWIFFIPIILGPLFYYLIVRRQRKKWVKWVILFTLLVILLINFLIYFSTSH